MQTGQEKGWNSLNPMPTLRAGAAAAVVNDRLFVIGGGTSPYEHLAVTEGFHPGDNSWLSLSPMPTPRNNVVAAVLDGRILVIAGREEGPTKDNGKPASNPTAVMEAYDPEADTWTARAPLPAPRVKPGVGVVDGRLYLLSGRSGDGDTHSIVCYDPAADSWSETGELPLAMRHSAGAVVDDTIYLMGGAAHGPDRDKSGTILDDVLTYNPATGNITRTTPMPVPRAGHAVLAMAGRLLVMGGLTTDRSPVLAVDEFDPVTATWRNVGRLDSPRAIFQAAACGETVYLAGGWQKLQKEINRECASCTFSRS